MASTDTAIITSRPIGMADLGAALAAGLRDFRRAPQFGLFFSAVYVVGGFVMLWLGAGHVSWVLATSLGFPLIAPFAAAGLYEVSRRLEKGIALDWKGVLGIVWAERNRQLPLLGAFIVFFFLVWTFLAHIVFALFMGLSTMTNISESWAVFLSADGLKMVFAEFVIGSVLALILFSLTVVSLPMLLDREVDVITAMLRSLQSVKENFPVMLVWAVTVAVLSFLALLPWFLGLMIVLPILGHATWHLYRRVIVD